jgi:peptidoglycan/LPS O-acetylase OafA/YrhL
MHARAKRLPMLGEIDFRSNGIGFLRLFFAAIVLWSHAYGIGGFGWDPIGHVDDGLIAGMLAVGGFFVLSGFLITRSYETVGNALRFIWHRVLRIFPAFWVCLVVTAFFFAPLEYVHERGTLAGFLAAPESPLTYIARNVLLVIAQPNIRGLLANVPAPFMLNGSLWTLAYEFGCYLAVAALGIVGIIRRTPALVAIASLVLFCSYLGLTWHFAIRGDTIGLDVFSLFVYFGFGSAAYLLRDRIPMTWWLASLCVAVLAGTLFTKAFLFVVIPCVSYLTLFAAMRLPIRSFDRRMDLSYGLYIYAFPIQQLLVLYHLNALGFALYVLMALAMALALAAGSWFAIERPSLAMKNLRLRELPSFGFRRPAQRHE